MILRSKGFFVTLVSVCLIAAAQYAHATTVATDTTLTNWGTYSNFQLSTVSATNFNGEHKLNSTYRTDMWQSFRPTTTFTLTEFDLNLEPAFNMADIRIRINTMTDTNAASVGNPPWCWHYAI